MTDIPVAPPVDAPPPASDPERTLSIRRVSEEHNLLPAVPMSLQGTSWGLIQHATMLARIVARTNFVPATFRGKPDSIAAAFLLLHELHIAPMIGLRQLYVTPEYFTTNNRTGAQEVKGGEILIAAQLMRAITRRGGHRLWLTEYTIARVTWNGQRRDDENTIAVTWTMDDAKRAKLVKADSAWEKTPRAMLSARASAELCRVLAEEELGGLYAVEEFRDDPKLIEEINAVPSGQDHPDEAPPVGASTEPGTRRRSLRTIEAPQGATEPATAAAPATDDAGGDATDGGAPESPAPADVTTPEKEVMPPVEAAASPVSAPIPAPAAVTPASSRPARTRARPVAVSTEPVIAVPGDELGPQGGGAGPNPEPSPGATDVQAPPASGESGGPATAATPSEPESPPATSDDPFVLKLGGRPLRVSVAIAARLAGIDRAALCLAVSEGRTSSARELNNQEALFAIDNARTVARGEAVFHPGEIGQQAFPRVQTPALLADTIATLRLVYTRNRDAAYGILGAVDPDWTQKGGLDGFMSTIPTREAIAHIRVQARLVLAELDTDSTAEPDPEEA